MFLPLLNCTLAIENIELRVTYFDWLENSSFFKGNIRAGDSG
jgi:hypothetical protein